MKKILLPVLAAALLAGCAKEGSNPANNGPVPIRLGSGIGMEVTSKAPIDPAKNSSFTASIVGWEGENAPSAYIGSTKAWQTTITTTASTSVVNVPTWGTTQFYNQNEKVNTYMIAWHPEGTLADDAATVSFENDGTKDAMIAQMVSGNKNTTTDPVLEFTHASAQIIFKVQTENAEVQVNNLQSITINDVNVITGFDLSDYSAIPSATAQDVNVAIDLNGQKINNTTAIEAGEGVMIAPDRKDITIDVKADDILYDNQAVTLSSRNIEAGKSYIITLTFKRQGITVDATVEAWQPGSQTGNDGQVDLI